MPATIKKSDFFSQDVAYYRRNFAQDLTFILKLCEGTTVPDYLVSYIKAVRHRHARAAVKAVRNHKLATS